MNQVFLRSLQGVYRLAVAERPGGDIGHTVLHVAETNSTNRMMVWLADDQATHGTVLLADHQTAGRGKGERVWHSTPGAGLCFSILLRSPFALETLSQITLVVAVAIAEAISKITCTQPKIKWPNDILINGRKICGILTELSLTPDQVVDNVIVGVGININNDLRDFPGELKYTASSVYIETKCKVNRIYILQSILESIECWIDNWCTHGFSSVRDAWIKHSYTLGKMVTLEFAETSVTGQAIDLGRDGSLLIRDESGEIHAFYSGETRTPKGADAMAAH